MAELITTSSTEPPVQAAATQNRDRTAAVVVAAGITLAIASAFHAHVPVAAPLIVIATIPAVLIDMREHRLPNRLVASAALFGAALVAATAPLGGEPSIGGLLLGALLMSGPLLLMHLLSPASMGFGDVKLAVVLGAAVGLVNPLLALAALTIGCAGAAIFGVARRRRTIAFGPALALGAAGALLLAASPFDVLVPGAQPTDSTMIATQP